jgi:hypothetical protein
VFLALEQATKGAKARRDGRAACTNVPFHVKKLRNASLAQEMQLFGHPVFAP